MGQLTEVEADFVNPWDVLPKQPICQCGQRLQKAPDGTQLPCASCTSYSHWCHMVRPERKYTFKEEPVKAEPFKELVFHKREHYDPRFPTRHAAFWWYYQ